MRIILSKWNDIIILLVLIYYGLVFYRVLRFPTETWKTSTENIKASKWSIPYQILLPCVVIIFLLKIFSIL